MISIQSVVKYYRSRHLQISNFKWWIFFNGTLVPWYEHWKIWKPQVILSDSVNSCWFFNTIRFCHGKHSCVECLQIHEMKSADSRYKRVATRPFYSILDKNRFCKSYNTFGETMILWFFFFFGIKSILAHMRMQMYLWHQSSVYDLENLILNNNFDAWTPTNLIFIEFV